MSEASLNELDPSAAAMAVAQGVDPGSLGVESLQRQLISQGASLGL